MGSWNTGVGQDFQYHRAVYPTAFGQRFRPVSYTHLDVCKRQFVRYANERISEELVYAPNHRIDPEYEELDEAITSVSYTHLDVYKRQLPLFVRFS